MTLIIYFFLLKIDTLIARALGTFTPIWVFLHFFVLELEGRMKQTAGVSDAT